jgi:cytochrome b
VPVWDAPVRVFHWLMAFSFAGAWLSAESERWRLVHISLGYTLGGLVLFRVLWGLVGSQPARFASFVRSPAAVWGYFRSLLKGQPQHFTGHNPAGGWAVLGLLLLGAATVALGWATETERLPAFMEEAHEAFASLMLGLVGLHVVAVVLSSRLHRDNLPRAMVTGRKQGQPGEGSQRPWRGVAALLLAAVLGFWGWQATQPPLGVGEAAPARQTEHEH